MIIVRRWPVNANKLPRNIRTASANSASSSSSMSTPVSSSSSSSSSSGPGSSSGSATLKDKDDKQSQPFDWPSIFSLENKSRCIQILNNDREVANASSNIVDDPSYKMAAVLIPLCYDTKGRPSILYNLRSSNLSKHKGEISFPGGSLDPEDGKDPVVGALRETEEELGISKDTIEVWTSLRIFPTISTHLGVTPVIGFIKSGPVDAKNLNINPDEVDHAFTVTLEHLCNPVNWDKKYKGRPYPTWKNLKVYSDETQSQEVLLWGLTSFITHWALSALVPSEAYKRVIPYFTAPWKEDSELLASDKKPGSKL